MFHNIDIDSGNGVLATDNDVHEGIGPISELIDMGMWVNGLHGAAWDRGALALLTADHTVHRDAHTVLCGYCGHDRGVHDTHTEVDVHTVTCFNCDTILAEWGEDL